MEITPKQKIQRMIAAKPDESSLRKSSLSQDEFHATKGFQ
jgi:hypothetical protein